MILMKNVRYFDGEQFVPNSAVLVSKTKIAKIYGNEPCTDTYVFDRVIDGRNRLLVPGYIDIHIHGSGGFDVMDASPEALEKIAAILAGNGTTSFLATTTTMPVETTQKAISAVKSCIGKSGGANILGIHLEGPFVNFKRKGAQNADFIQEPSVEAFRALIQHDFRNIKRVTLAPELGSGVELVKYLIRQGICVSAGHTCADAELIKECADAGMNLCTHIFNGMDPLHHRKPGVVGSVVLDDRISAEFIADLTHLHPDIVKLIVKVKGADRCILITDAMSAACLGDGTFALGGQKVIVKNGAARIENGSLAGSVIMLKDAVKNMIQKVGIRENDVFRMSSTNPAKMIGVDDRKGAITEGYDADLNLLDDHYNVEMTMIMGKVVSER